MADGSTAIPVATTKAAGSLKAAARVADATPESTADKPVALEEQTALPEALEGVGNEVVVVEEEDTTRELRRLESTLFGVMKQIKGIARTVEQRRQLIKRMEPLAEENAKLKEAMKLMEKNVQRAQHERDLAESQARDLEYQKGVLSEQLATASEQLQEQYVELGQLCQTIGQLQEEEKKTAGQAEKLTEELKDYRWRVKAQFDVLEQEART
ncbi:uncharacterized protein [Miscanthus floridulus]|uniref:uncharacterized protein n=1 Tax=Miscanthus floridulus TaxID=154761 RepID=UPI0034583C78